MYFKIIVEYIDQIIIDENKRKSAEDCENPLTVHCGYIYADDFTSAARYIEATYGNTLESFSIKALEGGNILIFKDDLLEPYMIL